MGKRKRRTRSLEIRDRTRLAGKLRLIVERSGLSVNAFAGEHGISQPLLWFLLNEKRKRVSVDTYHTLMRLTSSQEAQVIKELFLDDQAQDVIATYWLWMHRVRIAPITVPRKELMSLMNDTRVRRAFVHLVQVVKNRRHPMSRVVVAVRSALLPLERTHATKGVERSWSELTEDERGRFLAAGLDRERILLERDEERVRAQTVTNPKGERPKGTKHQRRNQLGPNDFYNYLTEVIRGVYSQSRLVTKATRHDE